MYIYIYICIIYIYIPMYSAVVYARHVGRRGSQIRRRQKRKNKPVRKTPFVTKTC